MRRTPTPTPTPTLYPTLYPNPYPTEEDMKIEDMKIEDIKTAKRQCESEIRAIIAMFEMQNGCIVQGWGIERDRNGIIKIMIDVHINI